jgi:hypothetical protein
VTEDEKIARVARGAHNLIVVYCRLHGDYTIKDWEDAEGWQRESTIDMVKHTLAGNYSPRAEHERWLDGKLKRGYVYGAQKNDDETKGPLTNPNIRPYVELPLIQRMKDNILIAATIGFASHYGLDTSKVPELTHA